MNILFEEIFKFVACCELTGDGSITEESAEPAREGQLTVEELLEFIQLFALREEGFVENIEIV